MFFFLNKNYVCQVDAGVGGSGISGMVKSESTTMLCDPTSPADNTATNTTEDGGGGGGQQEINGVVGSLLSSSGVGGPGNGCVKNSAGDEVILEFLYLSIYFNF